MATTTVSLADIDDALQRDAERIFAEEGTTASAVYQRLLHRTVEQQHVPLDLFRPNAETLEAMQEARNGKLPRYSSLAELVAELDAEEDEAD